MILLSGGFDPLHPGHIEMFGRAREYGEVLVALNSDDWLIRKKGFYFQPWRDRAKILSGFIRESLITPVDDSDGTVCSALRNIRPRYFGNGGDRTSANTPELALCEKLNIEPIFGLDDPATQHYSSRYINRKRVVRRWGEYIVLADSPWYKVKILTINPGKGISHQRHDKRHEYWFLKDADPHYVPLGAWHHFKNTTDKPIEMIEVQIGECEEDDIERS